MYEVWRLLEEATPAFRMLLLFPLGLVFGSFGYATHVRLAVNGSPRGPRSCCPTCGHRLGALELTPLVGYLWLRGACRHCRERISPLYPIAETAVGLLAAVGGLAGGWGGGAGAIGLTVGLLIGGGLWRRHRGRRLPAGSPGVALLESMVAIALITIISAPVLQVIVRSISLDKTAEERVAMTGLARQHLSQLESIARLRGFGPLQAEVTKSPKTVGAYTIITSALTPAEGSAGQPWADKLYLVEVTVRPTCAPQCKNLGGDKSQIVLVSYLWAR